jgi:hypothetical protein
MNVRFGWLLVSALLLVGAANAQSSFESYKVDALRFSQLQANGSTRTQSMGGAGSALGADLGAFVLNPANLGNYRRSEFSFTPGLLLNSSESAAGLAGQARTSSSSDGRGTFNIANFGLVIATRKDDNDASDWRSGAIGINFSRLASFSNRRTYALAAIDSSRSFQEFVLQDFVIGGNGSIQDVITNADNNVINNFADLGYNGFLLNFGQNAQGQLDTTFTPTWKGTARQTETSTLKGAINQIDIGYGASYRDRLYVGGSLGIVTARYEQARVLSETLNSSASDLRDLTVRDGYEVRGGGVNLRVGVVYRPFDFLRLGAAIQTPTFISEMKEQVEPTKLSTNFRAPFPGGPESVTSANASIAASEFQYSLTTPFRATGGVTLIGGKFGLISADIDYVNYASARLSAIDNDPSNANFSSANSAIRREYASAVNYRLGGELRLGEFRMRAGYGLYGTPYADATRNGERTVIAGGVGIRREKGYIDIGFARTTYTADLYSPYTLTKANPDKSPNAPLYLPSSAATAAEPVVSTKYVQLNPTVTIGFIIQ